MLDHFVELTDREIDFVSGGGRVVCIPAVRIPEIKVYIPKIHLPEIKVCDPKPPCEVNGTPS